MKPVRFLCFLLSSLPVFAQDTKGLYHNVKVVRIPTGPNTSKLESLVTKYQLNVWTEHPSPNSHLDVEVPREKYTSFTTAVDGILKEEGITTPIVTMHEDLGESIRKESEGSVSASKLRVQAGAVASPDWFNGYHNYDDHLTFLDDLVAQFPDNAMIVSAGQSFEGRDIKGIHIFGSSGPGHKPAIIWHGTVHAREWIATMVTEYLAYSLLTQYGGSADVQGYVNKYDFYIFPIVNPDGFVYSQGTDRLWRKNRQSPPSGSTCYGRDINRNWDIQWSSPGGASTDPCAQDYKGEAPADAPETRAIAEFINYLAQTPAGAKMYTDWHSYSQLFMFPYGYDCAKLAADNTELTELAAGFSTAVLSTHGTPFRSGPICLTIYPVTGGSTDYTYDVSKIKYSFAAELRDVGQTGFILPPEQIRPSGEEIWAGVKYLLANIK